MANKLIFSAILLMTGGSLLAQGRGFGKPGAAGGGAASMARVVGGAASMARVVGGAAGGGAAAYRTVYDDSTLMERSKFAMMPFNRLIRSAGRVIAFGDPKVENHALDFSLLPDGRHLAVEDRYGVAVLDLATQTIVQRWTFRDESAAATRDLMSTYCGIKSFVADGRTYIVWGAGTTHSSALMIAEWSAAGFGKVEAMSLAAVAPAPAALPNDVA